MRRILAVCFTALFCLATGFTHANEADLGFRAGYQRFSDADEGAFMGGGFFRIDWHRVIFVEANVLYNTKEVEDTDVEMIPVQLSALLFLLGRDGMVSPYLLGGGGMYWVRLTRDAGDSSENEFDFGWHLGFGMDYNFHERMFVEADFRYIWLDMNMDGQTVGDKLASFDNWMASVGLGFRL